MLGAGSIGTRPGELTLGHFAAMRWHTATTVNDGATAVAELVRYLDNATSPGNARKAIEWAATIDRILGTVNAALYGFDQLLDHLADGIRAQATDPKLYDDRRDRPGEDTAAVAADEIAAAIQHLAQLTRQLPNVRELTHHLGNDLARKEATTMCPEGCYKHDDKASGRWTCCMCGS